MSTLGQDELHPKTIHSASLFTIKTAWIIN